VNSVPYFVSQQGARRPYLACTSSVNMPTNVTVDSIETGPADANVPIALAEPAPRSRSQETSARPLQTSPATGMHADSQHLPIRHLCPLGDPTVVTSLYTPRHGNSAQLGIKRPIQTFRLRAAKPFPLKVVACLHLIQIANPAFACREQSGCLCIAHNVLQLTHALPAHIEHAFLIVVGFRLDSSDF
jgi:hypothetical protein